MSDQNNSINQNETNEDQLMPLLKRECTCCCKCCSSCGEEVFYAITFGGRLVITFYSFHALFFICNFIIQFVMLIPEILYHINSGFWQFFVIIIYFFFAILASTILVIPLYEFLLFPFLRYRNVLAHLQSLKKTMKIIHGNDKAEDKIELHKSNPYMDTILCLFEVLYVLGFSLGFSSITIKGKDVLRLIILISIYFYYLTIFFCYIIISIYLFYKLFKFSIEKNGCVKATFCFLCNLDENISEFFRDKNSLPRINLFCYAINPLLDSYNNQNNKQNRGQNEEQSEVVSENQNVHCFSCDKCFYTAKNYARLILFFVSFIIAIIIVVNQKEYLTIVFCFFFFLLMYILTLMINFPYFCRNKKTFGNFFSPDYYYKKRYKLEHPRMVSFLRIISFIIMFIVFILIISTFIFFEDKNELDKIKKISFSPSRIEKDSESLLPNICFSSIHNMNIHLFLPFIIDAYYYDDNADFRHIKSSLEIQNYKRLFFDNNYRITVGKNLIPPKNGKDSVKMIKYDITKNSNEITILSIKGTSNKRDVFLDLQLYFPSVLLNLLSTFSVFYQQKDTYSFKFTEYSLSIPYRLFSRYLVIDEYLEDLLKAYNDNKSSFKSKVIIVGHSLGGGLAKILGRFLGKQAISLSGPGVNAFHSLWDYEGSGENFEISAIDLVPDMDLVPRVEVSGGTIYRIVCKEGPLDCHKCDLSLCEVLIMCQSPNYKEYCTKVKGLNEKQIDAILESVKLN